MTEKEWGVVVYGAGFVILLALFAVYLWDGPGPTPPPGEGY